MDRLPGHSPSLPPPTLTGIDDINTAPQGRGPWEGLGLVHLLDARISVTQQWAGEGLGFIGDLH